MALQTRPPVITIMGHVDHGKTTLLDYIRHTSVVAKEAGGITQHIGAYQIEFKHPTDKNAATKKLTFIDTPGHAAFTKMRERGAQITDIIVLVVAANDGVKPQTIESIRHIKNSNATLIVAINKTDLPDSYPDMVKAQLAEHDILVQGYGGSVDTIELSAKTGQGVDKLLETITITAELNELKADPTAPLEAVVIEATMDPRRGAVATVIVNQGTLKPRQNLVADDVTGRIRQLFNENGQPLTEVTPGSPAEILGLREVPAVGAIVHDAEADYTTNDPASEDPITMDEETDLSALNDLNFDALFDQKPKLKLIIRADVEGTLEAIRQHLDDESVELLDSGVGEVSETDIELAKASGASILVFHSKVPRRMKEMAKTQGVKIKVYDVIYQLLEDLQKQMLKLMDSTIDEVVLGEAEIVQIFTMKGEKIAGCKVKTGELSKNDLFHLKRGEEIVAEPQVKSMMHGKEEISSVKAKNEFGCTFKKKKLDFQVGDILVAYKIEDEE